jgi:hypothetical protein
MYIIAIPTYNRYEIIIKKTLTMLYNGNISKNLINIFVADETEYINYYNLIPKHLYNEIIIGKKGIVEQRKFIINYYPENQQIVSIDDDVECIYENINNKLKLVNNIDIFFKQAFNNLNNQGLYIWGIYPVCNSFFMRKGITVDLRFIIGTLYGFINRKSNDIMPSLNITEKEDYEITILYYIKDGGVMRFNNYTIKTKKHTIGGLGITKDRFEANIIATSYLQKTYPNFVKPFIRKNGMYEIRLKNKK